MVGKQTAEIMGREFFEQKGKSNLDRCFAGEEISYADWFATPRGRKYRALSITPLRPDSQRVEAALVIARDLTDHMEASEALRQTQTELAHANRVTTMGQLAASIAHEVNQPITGVVTNADAALRWLGGQPPDLKEVRDASMMSSRMAIEPAKSSNGFAPLSKRCLRGMICWTSTKRSSMSSP